MKLDSRHIILQKIAAFSDKSAVNATFENEDASIYKPIEGSLDSCFQAELALIGGESFSFKTDVELYAGLNSFLVEKRFSAVYSCLPDIQNLLPNVFLNSEPYAEMDAAITECEFLVARTGSVLISSASYGGRQLNVFPPVHIVIAKRSQLVPFVTDALQALQEKYLGALPSLVSFISGPSRTADIEKTLVMGAHGPRKLYVFIAENL
jgi:L-lactate dehydrogenase complex protein LldG